MFLVLSAFVRCCYHLTGSISTSELSLDPDSCFAFFSADFRDRTISVYLSASPENGFFGTDTTDSNNLPVQVTVLDPEIPSTDDIDYEVFTRPIPVLCSPALKESDLERVVLPEGVITEDHAGVEYSVAFEQNSEAYNAQYGGEGNCIVVTRHIPDLETVGVTAGECVAMVLGLVLGMGLIAGCIIFLTPLVKKGEGAAPPPDGEQIPSAENGTGE
jgi:hypothetical protein